MCLKKWVCLKIQSLFDWGILAIICIVLWCVRKKIWSSVFYFAINDLGYSEETVHWKMACILLSVGGAITGRIYVKATTKSEKLKKFTVWRFISTCLSGAVIGLIGSNLSEIEKFSKDGVIIVCLLLGILSQQIMSVLRQIVPMLSPAIKEKISKMINKS